MNYKSIYEYVKFDSDLGLYDLITPTFVYNPSILTNEYEVTEYTEMRIDLIFKEMYNLEEYEVWDFLDKTDVILFINNIDNAFNIKRGMVLKYPPKLESIDMLRMSTSEIEDDMIESRNKILVYNKSTKKDPNREKYKKDKYLLPPVVLETPRNPVRLVDGDKFSVGGL